MEEKKKSKGRVYFLFAGLGCLVLCLIIVVFILILNVPREKMVVTPFPQPQEQISPENLIKVKELATLKPGNNPHALAWSPDGSMLAVSTHNLKTKLGEVQLWNSGSGEIQITIDEVRISQLVYSPDGTMLAGIGSHGLFIWSMPEGVQKLTIPLDSYGARGIAFSQNNQILVYQLMDKITLVEISTGKELWSTRLLSESVLFSLMPDGKSLLTVDYTTTFSSNNARYTIWNVDNGTKVRSFIRQGGIRHMAVLPDGLSLAVGNDTGVLEIFNLDSGETLLLFKDFRFGVPKFTCSPDGNLLAAGEGRGFERASPSGLRLFDLTSGREAPMLTGHVGVIVDLAFSPDGRLLATASEDNTVRLWGIPIETGQ